jgi:hypothetical protein
VVISTGWLDALPQLAGGGLAMAAAIAACAAEAAWAGADCGAAPGILARKILSAASIEISAPCPKTKVGKADCA